MQSRVEVPHVGRVPQVTLPGDIPTLRSLAEDAMVKFDVARWLVAGDASMDGLADALTEPWGDT